MFTMALVQCHVPSSDSSENLEHMLDLVDQAATDKPDLIVLPELCTFRYFCGQQYPEFQERAEPVNGPTITALADRAQRHQCHLVAPIYELDRNTGHRYNAAVLLNSEGDVIGTYRKLHIPDLPGERVNITETYYFFPGDLGLPVFPIGSAKIGFLICWDRNYPEAYRSLVMNGANVIIVVSATARGLGSEESPWSHWQYDHWATTLKTMALLNTVFVAAVNRVGQQDPFNYFGASAVFGPWGNELVKGQTDQEQIVRAALDLAEVEAAQDRLPFMGGRRPEVY